MPLSPEPSSAPQPSYVVQVTAQNFMQEVMQTSLQIPVLVYFTAAWCGPCKQFGPLLEKVVNQAGGRVKLARIDVDKSPELAQQFRVQSVPMVFIFSGGQPIDAFAGALPESEIKQLLTPILGVSPEEAMAQATLETAAQALAAGDAEQALQRYQTIYAQDPSNAEVAAGLARAHIALGSLEEAATVLNNVPEAGANHEAVLSAKAALKLAQSAPGSAEIASLQATLAKTPLDHESRLKLASALFAAGEQEKAVEELLTIIAKDKNWNEGAARNELLTFFEALGHTHPLTMQARRKLSSILFA